MAALHLTTPSTKTTPRERRPFTATRSAVSLFTPSRPIASPSEEVVAAVLMFGDVWEERSDGYVTRRLSAERLACDDLGLVLTDPQDRARAQDVIVVWNDAEDEIVRVVDLAPLRVGRDTVEQVNRYAAARKRSVRGAGAYGHAEAA